MKIIYEKVIHLPKEIIEEMYALMERYYDNLSKEQFESDLKKKEDVILLMIEDCVRGFTTIEHVVLDVDGKSVFGVFSGNTIMDLSIPPTLNLQEGFIGYIEKLKFEKKQTIYWFLICKGYKTYRYLDIYFKDYYPNYRYESPEFEKKIMDAYSMKKYPQDYIPKTGIIKNNVNMDYLREDVAPITDRVLKKPEVAFFLKMNPGHVSGDELVCLASFDKENLRSGYFRSLR